MYQIGGLMTALALRAFCKGPRHAVELGQYENWPSLKLTQEPVTEGPDDP